LGIYCKQQEKLGDPILTQKTGFGDILQTAGEVRGSYPYSKKKKDMKRRKGIT